MNDEPEMTVKTEYREHTLDKCPHGRPRSQVTRQAYLAKAVVLVVSIKDLDAVWCQGHSGTADAYDAAYARSIVAVLRPAMQLQSGAPPPG